MTSDTQATSPMLPFIDHSVLPSRPRLSRGDWIWRIVRVAAVVAAFFVMLRLDVPWMRWRYEVFPEGPEGLLKQIMYGFRDVGQVLPITVGLIIIASYDRRRVTIIAAVLFAQLLGACIYNPLKMNVARHRPYDAIEQVAPLETLTVGQTWVERSDDNRGSDTESFPSGHSAGAFAFAVTLVWFYPRIAWLLWVLAAGCAVSRFLDAVHWPSDCLAGAVIGYVCAWIALRPYVWTLPFRRRVPSTSQARLTEPPSRRTHG